MGLIENRDSHSVEEPPAATLAIVQSQMGHFFSTIGTMGDEILYDDANLKMLKEMAFGEDGWPYDTPFGDVFPELLIQEVGINVRILVPKKSLEGEYQLEEQPLGSVPFDANLPTLYLMRWQWLGGAWHYDLAVKVK